jgi:DNA-binding transcriptional LysR family regulator
LDWENLRFFQAVMNEGSLAAAGRRLGVKHSTVLRRIAVLEEDLGAALFERHPGGYVPTAAAADLLEAVTPFEETLVAVERRLAGQDHRLEGVVRIATVEPLAPWVCEAVTALRRDNPGLRTELLISPSEVSLARYEADIALRVTAEPPESLVGRRIASLAFGIYASRQHPVMTRLAGNAALSVADLLDEDWVGYADSRSTMIQARWMTQHVPCGRVVLRTDHTPTLVSAVMAGAGLSIMARYVGDGEPGLVLVTPVPAMETGLWLLTHPDLRGTSRIRRVMDVLADYLADRRGRLEGRG